MMNKQKSNKAWSWKAAAFLPMLALLLMAFGRTGEKEFPESLDSPTATQELPMDSVKQWSESDFKTMSPKSKDGYFFNGTKFLSILMNAQSRLLINNNTAVLKDVPGYIRKFRDYNSADEKTKLSFKKIVINGKEKMAANSLILIRKDLATSREEYLKLLNSVGNTILAIREKNASEIFGASYNKLNTQKKTEIDQLIPLEAYIGVPDKQGKLDAPPPPPPPPLLILIREDGNYIVGNYIFNNDNKIASLEELSKKVGSLQKMNPNLSVSVKAEAGVPLTRINEVKDVLRNAKVRHINYSAPK